LIITPLTVLGLTVAISTAYAAITDNMYKTANANWACHDTSAGDGNAFCRTDNATLTVYLQSSLNAASQAIVRDILDNSYNPTDLSVAYHSSGVYSGTAETDIVYQGGSSGMTGSTIGFTWCNDATDSLRCDQHYVRFRSDADVERELACHETGHAVGLTHGHEASPMLANNDGRLGCMETPNSLSWPDLESNNVDNINGTY